MQMRTVDVSQIPVDMFFLIEEKVPNPESKNNGSRYKLCHRASLNDQDLIIIDASATTMIHTCPEDKVVRGTLSRLQDDHETIPPVKLLTVDDSQQIELDIFEEMEVTLIPVTEFADIRETIMRPCIEGGKLGYQDIAQWIIFLDATQGPENQLTDDWFKEMDEMSAEGQRHARADSAPRASVA